MQCPGCDAWFDAAEKPAACSECGHPLDNDAWIKAHRQRYRDAGIDPGDSGRKVLEKLSQVSMGRYVRREIGGNEL